MQNENTGEELVKEKDRRVETLLPEHYGCRDFVFDPIKYNSVVYSFRRRRKNQKNIRMEDGQ